MGHRKGPAAGSMESEELRMRLTVIQKYLAYDGYRVLEGPLPVMGHDDMRTFSVELQRQQCTPFATLDLRRTGAAAGWFPIRIWRPSAIPQPSCKPRNPGTGPDQRRSYSVSSSRMPAVALGWRKAMRRPAAPQRGV